MDCFASLAMTMLNVSFLLRFARNDDAECKLVAALLAMTKPSVNRCFARDNGAILKYVIARPKDVAIHM